MSVRTIRSWPLLVMLLGIIPVAALALEPPEPGMLEQMAADGTLAQAQENAKKLGNYQLKLPKRGALNLDDYSPQQIADMIADNLGRSLDEKGTSAIGRSTSSELAWVELDLNHDRVVDERDLLALGQPRPKTASTLPAFGTDKMFILLIQFPYDVHPEYEGYFTNSHITDMAFGAGQSSVWYRGLHYYYDKASYSQLNIDGTVYGWYTAAHDRDYYHPLDNNDYPTDTARRQELIWEAITAADNAGADFSQYDNDGDGVMDEFAVLWTGPHGAWASFWWGYHTGWSGTSQVVDGVRPGNYSWQWERSYGFGQTPPTPSFWSALVLIHESGHGLGLPDWYDYDGSQGPPGGVGGLDMMDANKGDHSCYNKYLLGWLNPTVAFTNLNDEALDYSNANADAVQFMPGFDPVSPWSEYFMIQNRKKNDIDQPIPSNGLLIWHIDAHCDEAGRMLWDNSYTSHKQLRLMEADGLEEIETGDHIADAGDYYTSGSVLSPTSTPNSHDYSGTDTGITVDDISATGDTMTADITMFTSNPPSVSITAPAPGSTVSGDTTVTITASDDSSVAKVQLLIDGYVVQEWTSGPYSYTWNTLVDFNGTVSLTARAWDDGDQAASDTISVTVSNSGVTSYSDDFESGLGKWRVEDFARKPRGQFTQWNTRTSPSDGSPLGSGKEAYVQPNGDASTWHNAYDFLRGQRIDATGYTYPLEVKFYYRCRSGFSLYGTTDNGASWQKLADVSSSTAWKQFNRTFSLQGNTVYLELRYTGNVMQNNLSAHGANIDDVSALEAPSQPPTVTITSHSDGDTVSGSTTFTATATDDGSVDSVQFYLHGSLVSTDTTSPYEYTRNTLSDDNYPDIELMCIAYDNDGLPSEADTVQLIWNNSRPFPVSDDLESGDGDWSYQNDSHSPPWAYYTGDGSSGTHSMGWTGTIEANNSEGLWYWGEPPTSGRQCVDLAGSTVVDPVLRYKIKGDVPTTFSGGIYLYNTWDGYMYVNGWGEDQASWTQREVDLSGYIGYSGRIVWWLWSGSDTSGTGVWLDDIEVNNTSPTITSITPNRAQAGTTITIDGATFGDGSSGTVNFGGGVSVNSGDTVSWTNTEIQVDIPASATSGNVTVTVGGNTSNGVMLTVILPPPVAEGLQQL